MSDFLQNPNFKPDENFKNFIDGIFEEKPKAKKESTRTNFELDIPEAPAMAESEIKLASKIAHDEMEAFKQAFLEFQDKVSDMAIYTFLYPGLRDFGDECSELVDLIEDNFNQEKFTEAGKKDYVEAMKLRAYILSTVYNRYKNQQ